MQEKRKEITDSEEEKHNLYCNGVEADPNAQKYLYQAYRRKWKFYKIFQMAEKLALLGVTLYIPASTSSWKRLTAATSIAFVALVLVVLTHPLSDFLEAGLDVTSRCVTFLAV